MKTGCYQIFIVAFIILVVFIILAVRQELIDRENEQIQKEVSRLQDEIAAKVAERDAIKRQLNDTGRVARWRKMMLDRQLIFEGGVIVIALFTAFAVPVALFIHHYLDWSERFDVLCAEEEAVIVRRHAAQARLDEIGEPETDASASPEHSSTPSPGYEA